MTSDFSLNYINYPVSCVLVLDQLNVMDIYAKSVEKNAFPRGGYNYQFCYGYVNPLEFRVL